MMDGRPTVHFGASAAMERVAEGDGTTASLPAGLVPDRGRRDRRATSGSANTSAARSCCPGWRRRSWSIPGTAALLLVEPSYRGFANDHWHGQLRFLLSGGNVLPVNVVSLDNYARGIVPCEESPSWPIEALKAQAVAARSYAYRTRNTDQSLAAVDATADAANQTYCPIEREGAASASAVDVDQPRDRDLPGLGRRDLLLGQLRRPHVDDAGVVGLELRLPVPGAGDDRYDGAGGANPNHTWKPVVYGPIELARKFGLNGSVSAVDNDDRRAVAADHVAGDPPQGLRAGRRARPARRSRPWACARPTSGCWA